MSITNPVKNQQSHALKPFEQDFNHNLEHSSKRNPFLSLLTDSHGRNINTLL